MILVTERCASGPVARGGDAEQAWEDCSGIVGEVLPFTMQQAKITGILLSNTRAFGLSLGDRACLALALEHNAPVYTSDRLGKNLKIGIRINLIR